MKIVFISGINVFINNDIYDENIVDPKEELMVIYFKNIDLSYDYAKQFILNKNVIFFLDFSVFFEKATLDSYSFNLSDYTLHVNKNLSGIIVSFSPFKSNFSNLEDFVREQFGSLKYLLFLKNHWSFSIILSYLNIYFYFFLTLILFLFLILSYKLFYYNSINLIRKEEIFKFFYS